MKKFIVYLQYKMFLLNFRAISNKPISDKDLQYKMFLLNNE
ncbi:hypothetical protein JMUB3933_1388 [Leptotrichia wadei]|uniref:Uncharacterized protein n=1 Tax=Leptotrichia wadei TaxID=157687 RepID=A0A510K9P0_9FUSO|nr:hypothetical protein JMUB3933_1388 [Leptotrichia wadei]